MPSTSHPYHLLATLASLSLSLSCKTNDARLVFLAPNSSAKHYASVLDSWHVYSTCSTPHRLSYAAPRCLTRRSVGASAEIENAPRSHVFLEILVAMGSACAIVVCPLCLLFFDCEL